MTSRTMTLESTKNVKSKTTLGHPSQQAELVKAGNVNPAVDIQALRNAIPPHCFKPSYRLALWYLFRDLVVVSTLMVTAFLFIPWIEVPLARYAAWATYGVVQGLAMTGLWVLGHECGHMAFSPSRLLNDTVGFILHSSLITPYFSWKSTHGRHHIYVNNMAKDQNYVPPRRSEYANAMLFNVNKLEELTEDSPVVTFISIVLQQIIGFPLYLLTNLSGSINKDRSKKFLGNSHFLPSSTIFRPEEAHLILFSDIGIGLFGLVLWFAVTKIGFGAVALLYLQPYMWVNHWIVAFSYLQHTHPKLPKFEPEAWTFLKGATATVDRDFGWIGKHMLHNMIEFHVVHHLFSRIPQYYAEEATKAVIPLLGSSYHADKQRSFLPGLWESFTQCQWVEPDNPAAKPEDQVLYFKAGPSPAPWQTWEPKEE